MERICSQLIETYNTNLLNAVDIKTQALFYDISRKHKDGRKGKTSLMQLIYNHYSAVKPTPMFIGGPKHLTLWQSDRYHKTIYIFGEIHNDEGRCSDFGDFEKRKHLGVMRIDEFLEKLLQTTDVFIDLYLETEPFYNGEKYGKRVIARDELEEKHILGRTADMLRPCIISRNRGQKKCRLFRAHYIDVRDLEKGADAVSRFAAMLYLAEEKSDIKKLLRDKSNKKVITAMSGSLAKCQQFFEEQMLQNALVKKELNRSPFKNEILRFTTTRLRKEIEDNWEELSEIPKQLKNDPDDVLGLSMTLGVVLTSYVDAYTLARVFKTFSTERPVAERIAPGLSFDQPKEPHNIIIYAGLAHTDTYNAFLEHIGFSKLAETGNNIFQESDYDDLEDSVFSCIDLETFPIPFFK
jgi:predicted transcriptional regulator with HTH domain